MAYAVSSRRDEVFSCQRHMVARRNTKRYRELHCGLMLVPTLTADRKACVSESVKAKLKYGVALYCTVTYTLHRS